MLLEQLPQTEVCVTAAIRGAQIDSRNELASSMALLVTGGEDSRSENVSYTRREVRALPAGSRRYDYIGRTGG